MTNRTIAALFAAGLAACSSTAAGPPAVTEHDLSADPTLAVGIDQVGVTFLEPSDAASVLPDTGGSGVDVIPIELAGTTSYSLALDPEDGSGTVARVELRDATGAVLLAIAPATPSGTVLLAPGRYALAIHAGYVRADAEGADHRTVFLRPSGEPVAFAPGTNGSGPGTMEATPETVKRLIATKSCKVCDLRGAKLVGAQLRRAQMDQVKLDRADLSSADLSWAMMFKASLVEAKLRSTDLSTTRLSQADLRGADLAGAKLDHTFLDGAKWIDGRTCTSSSVGSCDFK